jgi:hypothetical protein
MTGHKVKYDIPVFSFVVFELVGYWLPILVVSLLAALIVVAS